MSEGAYHGRALRHRRELVAAGRIIVGAGGGRARGQHLRAAVADAVVGPGQRAPDAVALLQPVGRPIDIGLAAGRGEIIRDAGEVDAVAEGMRAVHHHGRGRGVLHLQRIDEVILREGLGEGEPVAIGSERGS